LLAYWFIGQVLDNPLTQSLMSNPDIIRQMLESNPQMQVTSLLPYLTGIWIRVKYWIRIRIEVKIQEMFRLKMEPWRAVETQNGAMYGL
jgi:hypothetical protein